jgi:serine/threonine protein kinase
MSEHLVGQTLGRYKIISLLGGGGMGSVYKAHDLTLQRDVAIKIMHPHVARMPNFRERFLQEARTAAQLDHPSIIQVFDFGQDRNLLYIVMEYIPGDNLEQMLRELRAGGKWVFLNEAIALVRQTAQALDYAHRHGILHRDIKPSNIMIEPVASEGLAYRPVITDLGLAKLAEGGVVTSDGTSMGTPAYMSPEQALGQATDPRSDVYSLGVLLFELATGRLPFPVKDLTQAIHYHTKEPPPAPRSIRPELPEQLEKIILKAMEKNPSARPPSASALEQSLTTVPHTAAETLGPTAMANAVSLITQYQQSLVQPRGGSVLEEFVTPTTQTRDVIQVLSGGKTTQTVEIKPGGITIGREADNGLVLQDSKASRHHAKVEFDGKDYKVLDLNSSNGTYLANARLLPGVTEIWTPDKALRIGDSWLRLLRAQPSAGTYLGGTAGGAVGGTRVDPSRVRTSAGDGRVGIYLDNPAATVEPGGNASLKLILINQGSLVDHFRVSLGGIPGEWVPGGPKIINLMPGAQQEIEMLIQPPRAPTSKAGQYTLAIQVASQADPLQNVQEKAQLTVASYSQFTTDLQPQKIRAGRAGRVTIRNSGNALETFKLAWKDRGDELTFRPAQAQVSVPEGQAVAAEFQASPRQTRWFGGEKSHAFTAQVVSARGETQTQTGELISRALLPPWVIPLLIVLCVCLAGAAGFFLNRERGLRAAATATALAAGNDQLATQQAATATAEFFLNANEATIEAVTATAAWLALDDDRDGLLNGQELEFGTLPNVPDTDLDGLSDADELNTRKTDPLKPDTDGDGINDGPEVSRALDPLKADTDDDGIPDAQDQAPGATSTPTPDEGQTAQAGQAATAAASQTAAAIASQTAQAQTDATQTAEAQASQTAAAQTAAAMLRIAYIFSTDESTANDYKEMLQDTGLFTVDLITLGDLLSTDLSPYRAILIGYETGNTSTWGDVLNIQANFVASSSKPVLGLGEGGYAFFGRLGLNIGWGNGWHGSGSDVAVVDAGQPAWSTPNSIAIPGSQVVQLYSGSGYVAIQHPDPLPDVIPIGRQSDDLTHYPIIQQTADYLLWGFDAGPEAMTEDGKNLFTNLLINHSR